MEREEALKFLQQLLAMMVQKKGSDLFITAGFPPAIKIDGKMTPVTAQALTPQHTLELAHSVMNDKQAAEFEATKECNFAISPAGHRPLPRQCFRAAGAYRHDHAYHQYHDPEN